MDIQHQIKNLEEAMAAQRAKIADIQRKYQILRDAKIALEGGKDIFHGTDLQSTVTKAVMQGYKKGEL